MTDVSGNTILLLIVRHFATVAGGWLIHRGYLDASAGDAFVGAVLTIGGVAGSIWQKDGQAKALALAEALRQRAFADVEYWRGKALKQPPAPSVAAKAQPLTPSGGTKLPQP